MWSWYWSLDYNKIVSRIFKRALQISHVVVTKSLQAKPSISPTFSIVMFLKILKSFYLCFIELFETPSNCNYIQVQLSILRLQQINWNNMESSNPDSKKFAIVEVMWNSNVACIIHCIMSEELNNISKSRISSWNKQLYCDNNKAGVEEDLIIKALQTTHFTYHNSTSNFVSIQNCGIELFIFILFNGTQKYPLFNSYSKIHYMAQRCPLFTCTLDSIYGTGMLSI